MKIYKHYKGDIYQLIADNVLHTETNEFLTIYRRISDNAIFARPTPMFHGFLEDGTKRFVEIKQYAENVPIKRTSKILKSYEQNYEPR